MSSPCYTMLPWHGDTTSRNRNLTKHTTHSYLYWSKNDKTIYANVSRLRKPRFSKVGELNGWLPTNLRHALKPQSTEIYRTWPGGVGWEATTTCRFFWEVFVWDVFLKLIGEISKETSSCLIKKNIFLEIFFWGTFLFPFGHFQCDFLRRWEWIYHFAQLEEPPYNAMIYPKSNSWNFTINSIKYTTGFKTKII